MKREFLQEFRVGDAPLPKEVIDAIMAENGRDIQKVKSSFYLSGCFSDGTPRGVG